MTVDEGVEILQEKVEEWISSNTGDSIDDLVVKHVKELSEDRLFQLVIWLKFSFGHLLTGEVYDDWVKSARSIINICN